MGLSKNIALENGIKVENAYYRVSYMDGSQNNLSISVSAYLSREHFLEGKSQLSNDEYAFKPDVSDDAPNFFKQSYAFLKSLDYFKDAKDVLEEGQSPIWDSDIQ